MIFRPVEKNDTGGAVSSQLRYLAHKADRHSANKKKGWVRRY